MSINVGQTMLALGLTSDASEPSDPSSVNDNKVSAGDPIPTKCSVIEVRVGELKQLFNSIDPSPFRNRDLDREAEGFIVGWAKDFPRDVALALVVDLDREAGLPDKVAILRDAIHEFFGVTSCSADFEIPAA